MGLDPQKLRATTFSKSEIAGYITLIVVGGVMLRGFMQDRDAAAEAAHQAFALRQDADSREVTQKLNASFVLMYQGLRTIARLPAIRALGSQSTELSSDALTSAQEIYNNLAENVSVSELYVIAADFDPELQVPGSDRRTRPLITLDQLIVGQNADMRKGQNQALQPHSVAEEIEIHEYRVMKRQIETFRNRFQRESQISGLSYPASSSEEVITCDNSRYAPSAPNDNARKGIVYSIPYYAPDGNFAGIVSAVILTSVLGDHLRDSRYTLRNEKYRIAIRTAVASSVSIAPTSSSAYSKLSELTFPDLSAPWVLSSEVDYKLLYSTPQYRAINYGLSGKSLALMSALTMLAAALRWHAKRHVTMAVLNMELESRISERTDALAGAKREAEIANAEKSRFLARVSHEIRTPLHAIISATELMSLKDRSDADTTKFEIIKSSSRMLAELVNQVLDLSSIEQGRIEFVLETFSPEEMVQSVCKLLQSSADQKTITLTHAVKEPVADFVIADPRLIRQVLINLIGNALKYTDHGRVDVLISTRSHADQRAAHLQFDVADTGRGIPADRFGQLFQPFQRDPQLPWQCYDSTGLGLSITKRLVELMGGELFFESEVGKGSTFSFLVPVLESNASQQNAVNDVQAKPDIGAFVILAEDNPQMQYLTGQLLTEFGCRFVIAQDGLEVFSLLQRQSFDLVLMDCAMPRLNGLDATRMIRERETHEGWRTIPIVALTANAFDLDAAACKEAGMSDFLSKPFTAQELRAVIERCLADRTQTAL